MKVQTALVPRLRLGTGVVEAPPPGPRVSANSGVGRQSRPAVRSQAEPGNERVARVANATRGGDGLTLRRGSVIVLVYPYGVRRTMSAPSDPTSDTMPPGSPSQQVRTIVTLLLLFHLFAIGLAIMTGSESGASQLLGNIKLRTPGLDPYLTQLWLDHGYDYGLTSEEAWDRDIHLEVTVNYLDGHKELIIWPPLSGMWPSERRQRYEQLATFLAKNFMIASNEERYPADDVAAAVERKHLLARSVGAAYFGEHPGEVASVTVRASAHRGQIVEELSTSEHPPEPGDKNFYQMLAEMSVVLDGHGRPVSVDIPPVLEVAPLKPQHGKVLSTPAERSR